MTYKPQYGIAVDQFGTRFRFGKNCRKDLSDQIPGKISIMYIDYRKDGDPKGTFPRTRRAGYVMGEHWLSVFVPYKEG